MQDPTIAGRTHTRTGSPSLPSRAVSDGAARFLLASAPNQESARCDRPTNATRTKTSTRTSLVPGVSTALRRGDSRLGSGLRGCSEDRGHRRVHVLRKSLRRVLLVRGLGRCLPEPHGGTEPLTLLSCAAFLRRAVLRPRMNTRATHRDRLVRSPRDRRTIRDGPECLPPSGTLRSDRPVSFDGGTGHQDP